MLEKLIKAMSDGEITSITLEPVSSEDRVHRVGEPKFEGRNVRLTVTTKDDSRSCIFGCIITHRNDWDRWQHPMKKLISELFCSLQLRELADGL
jgi:hypothetical protein